MNTVWKKFTDTMSNDDLVATSSKLSIAEFVVESGMYNQSMSDNYILWIRSSYDCIQSVNSNKTRNEGY